MKSVVDTHCHLDLDTFDDDRADVLKRALSAGVAAMILIAYNPDRWKSTSEMSARWPFLLRAVGIHPNDAQLWSDDVRERLCAEVDSSSPVAIGEIGLDFYRTRETESAQRTAFSEQLAIAHHFDLPVVIHQRSAEEDVLEVLNGSAAVAGVMHCFGGGPSYARRCLELGFYLGIGGTVTYPRSDLLREAVAEAPLDRLLLETDAPFLAPQSRRGKRNEPSLLAQVIIEVARIRNTSIEEIAAQTTANAVRLFGGSVLDAVQSGQEYQ